MVGMERGGGGESAPKPKRRRRANGAKVLASEWKRGGGDRGATKTTVRRRRQKNRARAQLIPLEMGPRQGGRAQHPSTAGHPTLVMKGKMEACRCDHTAGGERHTCSSHRRGAASSTLVDLPRGARARSCEARPWMDSAPTPTKPSRHGQAPTLRRSLAVACALVRGAPPLGMRAGSRGAPPSPTGFSARSDRATYAEADPPVQGRTPALL